MVMTRSADGPAAFAVLNYDLVVAIRGIESDFRYGCVACYVLIGDKLAVDIHLEGMCARQRERTTARHRGLRA